MAAHFHTSRATDILIKNLRVLRRSFPFDSLCMVSDITLLYTAFQHSVILMAFPDDPRLLKANFMQAPANEWSYSEDPHLETKHPGNHHPEPRHDPQKHFIQPTPTSKMSSTPSTGEASTFDKKPVLSDEQRKANHTSSETNRRNRIKAWYWDLCQLVPDLQEKAPENCKRERLVMDQTREFSRATMVRRNQLIDALEAQGRDPGKELGLTVSIFVQAPAKVVVD